MDFDLAQATSGLHQLAGRFAERLPYLGLALAVFIAFYLAGVLVRAAAARFTLRTQRHRSLGIVLGRLAHGAIVLLGLLVALVIAVPGFTPGQLVSVLGLSSVAIGFAFRDILQNFLAGVLLLLSEPFRIGDQIRSGEFEGTVENIETRATFIRTYDGRRIVIPNSTLFVNAVTVNTAHQRRRLEYDVTLGSEAQIGDTKAVMLRAIRSAPDVLADPPPDAVVVGFNDATLTIRLRWWIAPPDQSETQKGLDAGLARVREALLGAGSGKSPPAASRAAVPASPPDGMAARPAFERNSTEPAGQS